MSEHLPTPRRDPTARDAIRNAEKRHTPTIFVDSRSIASPEFGEVILTFHAGRLKLVEQRVKEKID